MTCARVTRVGPFDNSSFTVIQVTESWSIMNTIIVRSLSLAALAWLAFAGSTAAQDKSPALLNALEVRQLVAHGEPGDHARLTAHFSALADQYTAEAKRHTSMSQAFVGNPSRNLGTGMSAHCKRLAELNTQSATTVRQLAVYHEKLATGPPSTPPREGAPFQRGAGAPAPTDQELKALAAKASTPADHLALEEYFLTLAKRYAAAADQHVALAQTYRGTRLAPSALHCDRLVTLSRDSARQATEAAGMHKALAGVAR